MYFENPSLLDNEAYVPGLTTDYVSRKYGIPIDDVAKLGSAENPFGPSPKAQEVVMSARKIDNYPDWTASALREKIAMKYGYTPEQVIQPKSRTFIPARLTDNPYYMATGYMSTLQALPEPLRSQMLRGDFMAGVEDDAMQVIPTHWVEIAQARWTQPDVLPAMDSLGVDVARGGKDSTVLIARHGWWFSQPQLVQGEGTNTGPKVAGLVVSTLRDHAPVHLDVIGVGASPYDYLNDTAVQVMGVNVSEKSLAKDKSGRLSFFNLRSQLWWELREALDPDANNGIALPPDPKLLAELCAPKWSLRGASIQVESREEIVKRTGRSPDRASALILANMDTPRRSDVARLKGQGRRGDYDPMRFAEQKKAVAKDYDPLFNGYR